MNPRHSANKFSVVLRLLVLMLGLSNIACVGLHFRKASVLSSQKDAKQEATRVRVTFEVWDGAEQLTGLSKEAFTVYEDGQPATSESLSDAARDEIRMPVFCCSTPATACTWQMPLAT